jgi:predicted nucleic acid-binding protein
LTPTVLVDSSAWIQYLRSGQDEVSETVDDLLQEDRAALCGMVELEVVQGLRSRERRRVSELFSVLTYLETERRDYIRAGERLRELREGGITVPAADCIIGVLALRHGLPLLTLDRHFDHFPDLRRFPAGGS